MARRASGGPFGGTGTLIFGLVLTVIGAAQLIGVILGRPVWDSLWRLWPVLLIVMGVKILIDHYTRARV